MTEPRTGVLTITSVPDSAREPVILFLEKYGKSATREQIEGMLSQLPLQLGSRVPEPTARRVVEELGALGAVARFVPNAPPGGAPPQAAPREERKASFREVLLSEAFAARTARFPVPASYRAGLAVVAAVMVLLVLIYLGIIASAAYGLLIHAVRNTTMPGHGIKGFLFLYIGPLIVGCLLIFFMVKPLFARLSSRERPYEITRGSEPLLFAFVEKICAAVGAPMPRKICVDNQANASASLDGGILGAIFRRDLVLTIGLPLAAGLDVNGFAGVLAHEFGHFSQASGMRLTYIIRSLSFWFARVVFEEDEWDFRLRRWSKSLDIRVGVILYVARFFIWITRKILFLLMKMGNGVSCYMMRQMEFDADWYEAALVGSAVFESTSLRLAALGLSSSWALNDAAESWEEGRLPDNLTALALANLRQMKPETLDELQRRTMEETTGLFDTHPATRERIEAAKRIDTPPIFSWSADRTRSVEKLPSWSGDSPVPPASALFSGFDDLSRKATFSYYRQVLGMAPEKRHLVDVASLVRTQESEQRYFEALERYFLGKYSPWLPIGAHRVPGIATSEGDRETLSERLRTLRELIRQTDGAFDQVLRGYWSVRERVALTAQARVLMEAGFRIDPKDFRLPRADIGAVETAEARIEERSAAVLAEMGEGADRHLERLVTALRLLHLQGVAEQVGNGDQLREGMQAKWDAFRVLERESERLQSLHVATGQLNILLHQLTGDDDNERLFQRIHGMGEEVRAHLDDLARGVANVPYPFDHSAHGMTLDTFIVGNLPKQGDISSIADKADSAVQSTLKLRARLAAHFAAAAEKVETALGLEPLHLGGK